MRIIIEFGGPAAGECPAEFRAVSDLVAILGKVLDTMSKSVDHLTQVVAGTRDVQQGAILLISGLSDRIKQAAGDQTKLDALAADLDNSKNALAAAIVANTPAAPPEEGGPTPGPTPTPTPTPTPDTVGTPGVDNLGTTTAPAPGEPAAPPTDKAPPAPESPPTGEPDAGNTAFDNP